MSKLSELRALRYGRSVDAPINFRHRTGDSEGGGNMLDLYAQEKSVEDVIFEGEDDLAKARFLKGFSGYLRKVFSRTEREFLKRLMSGGEKLQDVGRGMGVDWFKYMQSIQKKAYKNTAPLLKLVELSGWSRAEEFTTSIMRRLSLLEDGAELDELIPNAKNRAKVREALKGAKADNATLILGEKRAYNAVYYMKNRARLNAIRRAYNAAYRAAHREENNARQRVYNATYRKTHREKIKAYQAAYMKDYYAKNREKIKGYYEANRYEANREEIKAYQKAYQAAHREAKREEYKAYQKAYQAAHREELKAKRQAYREARREERKAYDVAYREAHREEIKERRREYRARKKAEREASRQATEGGEV